MCEGYITPAAVIHDIYPQTNKTGADDPIRTDDLSITNALLYQLSYVGSSHGVVE